MLSEFLDPNRFLVSFYFICASIMNLTIILDCKLLEDKYGGGGSRHGVAGEKYFLI